LAFQPAPVPDRNFRRHLLDFYIEGQTSADLGEWLREIGQDPRGTLEERKARVLAHTQYLDMPADEFPRQTQHYLQHYTAEDLADLCVALSLPNDGPKDCLYRRIFREVGYREGWLPRIPPGSRIDAPDLALFLAWYPIVRRGKYERDFYPSLYEELADICGAGEVHEQLPIAHGTTLKIDFHVGHPQASGIGIEVKMPTNNAEIQRGLGQVDQYLHRYGPSFILLIFPDFINEAQLTFMTDQLALKNVRTVIKLAN